MTIKYALKKEIYKRIISFKILLLIFFVIIHQISYADQQELINKYNKHFNKKEYKAALIVVNTLLKSEPNNFEFLQEKVKILSQTKQNKLLLDIKKNLINRYDMYFKNKSYKQSLKIVNILLIIESDNLIFLREKSKMLAALGRKQKFLSTLRSLRTISNQQTCETVWHIVKHSLTPNDFVESAKFYFTAIGDYPVLHGWPKIEQDWDNQKNYNCKTIVVNKVYTATSFPTTSPRKTHQTTSARPVTKTKRKAQQIPKQVKIEAEAAINQESKRSRGIQLLKFCKKHKQYGFLVFSKFFQILKRMRYSSLSSLKIACKNMLKAIEVSSFDRHQEVEFLIFLLESHLQYKYCYNPPYIWVQSHTSRRYNPQQPLGPPSKRVKSTKKRFSIPIQEIQFLRHYASSVNAYLDNITKLKVSNRYSLPKEEKQRQALIAKAIALKEILQF